MNYVFSVPARQCLLSLGHMFLTIPFNMFYYIALKYGNFLLETLDIFPWLKDAYPQSSKLYENRISSWYDALQQILNNIPKLKQQKVSKQTVKKILPEAHTHQWSLDRNKCSDGKLRTYVKFKTVYGRENYLSLMFLLNSDFFFRFLLNSELLYYLK